MPPQQQAVIPVALKALTAYIRRAEELDRDVVNPDAPVIAYFCRKYAMEKGISTRQGQSSPEINGFLLGLMDTLEEDKRALGASALDDTGAITCENYAHSIFAKADEEDRAGTATGETAKGFYKASAFFDILEQFGDMDPETQ